jgi:hypothetical protein
VRRNKECGSQAPVQDYMQKTVTLESDDRDLFVPRTCEGRLMCSRRAQQFLEVNGSFSLAGWENLILIGSYVG